MRGRTNVLGFSEEFINANTIEAIADENIVSGNFVKFYNAISGGKDIDLSCDFMMELSDGRLLLAGPSSNGFTGKVVIIEKQGDRFVQNLPAFPFTFISYSNANLNYSSMFLKTGTNEFICVRKVYVNESSIPLRITTCYFDVVNNELKSKDIDVFGSGEVTKLKNILLTAESGVKNLSAVSSVQCVNIYEIDGNYYCIINYGLSARYGTSTTYMKRSIVEIFKIKRTGTTYENRNYGISNWSILSSSDMIQGIAGPTTVLHYVGLSSIIVNNGIFVICEGYRLFYVQLTDFDSNEVSTFSEINLYTDSMYKNILTDSSVFTILCFENDYLYLMVAGKSSKLYYAKIYFYDYTKSNFKYLKWDEVNIFSDIQFRYNPSSSFRATTINFCKVGSSNIKRYFVSAFDSNNNEITFLIDADESKHELIIYPYNVSQNVPLALATSSVLSSINISNTNFIVNKSKILMNYNIINNSELVGSLTDKVHVLNAVDESYIMGVAKESGSSGSVIECYKAKTS